MKQRDTPSGMVEVYEPEHPLSNQQGVRRGWVLLHRKVAWDHGLLTDPSLRVKHHNGNTQDNRVENLYVSVPRKTTPCQGCGAERRSKSLVCRQCKRAERDRLRAEIIVNIGEHKADEELIREVDKIAFGMTSAYMRTYFRKAVAGLVISREKRAIEDFVSRTMGPRCATRLDSCPSCELWELYDLYVAGRKERQL